MKPRIGRVALVSFFIFLLPMAKAFSSGDAALKIVEPANMQALVTSNVHITLEFSSAITTDRHVRAWLNGKAVESLFELTDDGLSASAVLSVRDGVKASVNGPRMNVFRAEVDGPDGKLYQQTRQFLVDCTKNQIPVAQIRLEPLDQHVFVNQSVAIDGGASFDVDQDPLAYHWTFVDVPKKSKAEFSDPSSVTPAFVPDIPGTYIAKLTVSDYKVESEPVTVAVTVDVLKVLVDRQVLGPAFEELSLHAKVDQFDGSQSAADYHVVVLDGNKYTPQELITNPLLREAAFGGKWVLLLNVKSEHKTIGAVPHLSIASHGDSSAYLFRRFLNGNTPVFRIFELPLPDMLEAERDPALYLKQVSLLLREIRKSLEAVPLQYVQALPPESPIPDNLINCRWDYTTTIPVTKYDSGRQDESKGRIQNGSYTINYTFTLFLDNYNQPMGNSQYLLLQIDAESNPNDFGSHFIATDSDMDKHNEYAWFQDKLTMDIKPNDDIWHWVANNPTSPNYETTYSTDVSFDVGFSKDGASASFGYSSGESYTLTDWGISGCGSSGTYQSWIIRSTNPPQHDGNYDGYDDMYDWFYGMGKPKQPNSMSMGQTQFHTSVVWKTDAVKNQVATFTTNPQVTWGDNWCAKDLGTTCCSSWNVHSQKSTYGTGTIEWIIDPNTGIRIPVVKPLTWSLDLGTVIPIEVETITFSQYPALVPALGGTIKGNIVLKEPAKVDTWITNLSSDNIAHAQPRTDRVTIQKGKRTASFDIDVNSQYVTPGENFFAYISAFYAKKYTYQFAMQALDTRDLKPPTTSPAASSDYSQWGGTTGSTGNWVDGYLVRYAVSFVSHSGESALGPWCDWIGPGQTHAMPFLTNLPTDTANLANSRKVYRQFYSNYQASDPSQGITLVGTINDNTTTTYLDNTP